MEKHDTLDTNHISKELHLFIKMAKAYAIISRRFDNKLSGWGLGFNDFIILFHISQAPHQKMRRIDLAEKIGLTPSGVTRQLLPMEKIGLIKSEATVHDARVREVSLAPGGKRLLSESMVTAEYFSKELLEGQQDNIIKTVSTALETLGKYHL